MLTNTSYERSIHSLPARTKSQCENNKSSHKARSRKQKKRIRIGSRPSSSQGCVGGGGSCETSPQATPPDGNPTQSTSLSDLHSYIARASLRTSGTPIFPRQPNVSGKKRHLQKETSREGRGNASPLFRAPRAKPSHSRRTNQRAPKNGGGLTVGRTASSVTLGQA